MNQATQEIKVLCANCKEHVPELRCDNAEAFALLDAVFTHKCPVCGYVGMLKINSLGNTIITRGNEE